MSDDGREWINKQMGLSSSGDDYKRLIKENEEASSGAFWGKIVAVMATCTAGFLGKVLYEWYKNGGFH